MFRSQRTPKYKVHKQAKFHSTKNAACTPIDRQGRGASVQSNPGISKHRMPQPAVDGE